MRRVLQRLGQRQVELARLEAPPHVGEPFAVFGAHAGDDLAGRRIDDVAARVDGDERRDDEPVRQRDGGAADAALHRAARGRPSCRPSRRRRRRRCPRRPDRRWPPVAARNPHSAVGRIFGSPTPRSKRIAAGHDRHDGAAELEADALLLEVAHDAAGRVEAEGAAAAEHDRVHLLDARRGREQIGLARAGRAAADVDAGGRALLGEDDRAPGRPFRQRVMADLEARHGRQPARWRRLGRQRCGAIDDRRAERGDATASKRGARRSSLRHPAGTSSSGRACS